MLLNLEAQRPAEIFPGARRQPPLPPMRLGRFAQAGLIGLRMLLGLSAAMAAFAAFHTG